MNFSTRYGKLLVQLKNGTPDRKKGGGVSRLQWVTTFSASFRFPDEDNFSRFLASFLIDRVRLLLQCCYVELAWLHAIGTKVHHLPARLSWASKSAAIYSTFCCRIHRLHASRRIICILLVLGFGVCQDDQGTLADGSETTDKRIRQYQHCIADATAVKRVADGAAALKFSHNEKSVEQVWPVLKNDRFDEVIKTMDRCLLCAVAEKTTAWQGILMVVHGQRERGERDSDGAMPVILRCAEQQIAQATCKKAPAMSGVLVLVAVYGCRENLRMEDCKSRRHGIRCQDKGFRRWGPQKRSECVACVCACRREYTAASVERLCHIKYSVGYGETAYRRRC